MAEALARHLGDGIVQPSSAGIYPAAVVQPETFQVLKERGISLEPRQPRSILLVQPAQFDVIVNMSETPLNNLLFGFAGREIVWYVPDPIGQTIQVYRAVRDEIERKVTGLVEELRAASRNP
jgi:arsenate reductase